VGLVIAVFANLLANRGPFVLSQTQSDQKLYFRSERLGPPNFIGLRPSPVFTMVNNAREATRYNHWLSAWHYRQALHRASDDVSAIAIERAPRV